MGSLVFGRCADWTLGNLFLAPVLDSKPRSDLRTKGKGTRYDDNGWRVVYWGGFISGWVVHALGLKRTLLICFGASFILAFILFRLTTTLTPGTYFQIAFITIFFGMSQGALSMYIPGTLSCFTECNSNRRLF
ncbi:MAG: hypothetical protein WDM78_11955 [Puia sp.]